MVKELWTIASGLNRLFVPYIALCEEKSKNGESFGLIRFYLASELQFTDIPVKEREKHVTIAGYFVFARQGEKKGKKQKSTYSLGMPPRYARAGHLDHAVFRT